MLTLTQIRNDLRDLKYYYAHKEEFDEAFKSTGVNDIAVKAQKYNDAVKSASPKLFDLYFSLYLKNHTQESLANKLCYTTEYIQMLNKQLLKFLQSKLED